MWKKLILILRPQLGLQAKVWTPSYGCCWQDWRSHQTRTKSSPLPTLLCLLFVVTTLFSSQNSDETQEEILNKTIQCNNILDLKPWHRVNFLIGAINNNQYQKRAQTFSLVYFPWNRYNRPSGWVWLAFGWNWTQHILSVQTQPSFQPLKRISWSVVEMFLEVW